MRPDPKLGRVLMLVNGSSWKGGTETRDEGEILSCEDGGHWNRLHSEAVDVLPEALPQDVLKSSVESILSLNASAHSFFLLRMLCLSSFPCQINFQSIIISYPVN